MTKVEEWMKIMIKTWPEYINIIANVISLST